MSVVKQLGEEAVESRGGGDDQGLWVSKEDREGGVCEQPKIKNCRSWWLEGF